MFGYFSPPRRKLVKNPGFENAPPYTADTNTAAKYIDGTAAGSATNQAYGSWAVVASGIAAAAGAAFDPNQHFSGNYSMRLSTLDATGTIVVGHGRNSATPTVSEVFIVQPNTSYTITARVKTNNVASNGAFIDFRQFSGALSQIATNSSSKLSGTNDWTLLTITVTTGATAAYGMVILRNNVAGNVSDAWFDSISVRRT